jgi:hypothetical protein
MIFTKGLCGRRTDNLSPSANLNFGSDVPLSFSSRQSHPAGKGGRGTSKYEETSDASSHAVPYVHAFLALSEQAGRSTQHDSAVT